MIYINFFEYLKLQKKKIVIKFKKIIKDDILIDDDTNFIIFEKMFRIKYEDIIVLEYCRNFIKELNDYIRYNYKTCVSISIYKNKNPFDITEKSIKRILLNLNNSYDYGTLKNPIVIEFDDNISKIIKEIK